MASNIEIQGGAGAEVTAAIAAVVSAIDEQEREAAATRPKPVRRSQWAQAGRPLERRAPMTSLEYDRLPGSSDEEDELSAGM
jgi:hypothetical protein